LYLNCNDGSLPETMKRSLLLFFLFPLYLFPQKQEEKSAVSFGVQTGFNLSKLKNDTLDVRNVLLPFLGINLRYQAAPKFNIQVGFQYSFRGANVKSPKILKFRSDYIDVQLLGMYSIFSELRVQAGIQYAMSLSSSLQRSIMKNILVYMDDKRNYPSQFEVVAGLELTAQKIINVGFLYTIPLKKMDYANLQFVIRVKLFEPKAGKKEKDKK